MNIANILKPGKFFGALIVTILTGMVLMLPGCGSHGSDPPVFPPTSEPIAPIGISAVAGYGLVTISWSSAASAASYKVYRSLSSGGTGTVIASGMSVTSYTDNDLLNGTSYYYTVSGVNSFGEGAVSSEVSAVPGQSPGTITITGTVQYQDKEYGVNGFTGSQPYKAVRYAAIDLVDAASTSSPPLDSTITGPDGTYSLSFPASSTVTVYVRVNAEATLSGATPQVGVKNLWDKMYAVAGSNFIPSGPANVNISIPASSIAGVFNILDVFTAAYQFAGNWGAPYLSTTLFAYWQVNSSVGTYYCNGGCSRGDGIYVYNVLSEDTDEYDDDVLYHEFGHFAAAYFSADQSRGGMHRLSDSDLDMRLTWSEGWSDSFPGVVKLWLSTSDPELLSSAPGTSLTQYIDTRENSVGIAIDMNKPDGTYGSSYFYAANEVAVAKILLDLNKHFGMQYIWDVFSDFKINQPLIDQPVNLELFWDRWHSLGKPFSSGPITIDSIFSDRLIIYTDLDSNNTFSSATTMPLPPTTTMTQALYGTGDEDFFVFNAVAGTTYSITTQNLTSGADTYIELYSSASLTAPISFNDNSNTQSYKPLEIPSDIFFWNLCESISGPCHENRSDILSSSITFVPSTSGSYYIKVYSSPTRPVSAGRYGSYRLSLSVE